MPSILKCSSISTWTLILGLAVGHILGEYTSALAVVGDALSGPSRCRSCLYNGGSDCELREVVSSARILDRKSS